MHASASCSANASVASAQAKVKFDVSVYVVTDRTLAGARGVEASVSSALAGGATMVQ